MCHCVKRAHAAGYKYVGMQNYGLCYGSEKGMYQMYGGSSKCVDEKYNTCSSINTESLCVGLEQVNYVYEIL